MLFKLRFKVDGIADHHGECPQKRTPRSREGCVAPSCPVASLILEHDMETQGEAKQKEEKDKDKFGELLRDQFEH